MLALGVVSIVLSLAGCASQPAPKTGTTNEPAVDSAGKVVMRVELPEVQRDDAMLVLDNRGTVDVTVSVLHDGLKERLFRSIAAHRDSLYIPARLIGLANSLRLTAETAGARSGTQAAVTTEAIALRPGMRLLWTIESDLARSHLGIY